MSVLQEQHARWAEARGRLWATGGSDPRVVNRAARERMTALLDRPEDVLPFRRLRFGSLAPIIAPIDEALGILEQDAGALAQPSPVVIIATWKQIAKEVCSKHRVALVDLISARRDQPTVRARHEAFYRCRTETTLSLPQIGRRFGGKDHTTVLHGVRKHEERMRLDSLRG